MAVQKLKYRGAHMVYVLRMACAPPAIKIGFCRKGNLKPRLAQTQSHSPFAVEVIGTIEGERLLEQMIQLACQPWNIRGEWFSDCPQVRRVIEEAIRTGGRSVLDPNGFEADATWMKAITGYRKEGLSHRLIAERLGVSRHAIQYICEQAQAASGEPLFFAGSPETHTGY